MEDSSSEQRNALSGNVKEEEEDAKMEEMSKEIKLMKAKILLLERRESRLNYLEEQNRIKNEYISNLERNVASIYQKLEEYEKRVVKCEDTIKEPEFHEIIETSMTNESMTTLSGNDTTVNLDTAAMILVIKLFMCENKNYLK